MTKILYTDKVDSEIRNVPNINKVTAADMNEIKASVNVNVDNIAEAKTAALTTLVNTNLPVSPATELQSYAESNDAAVLRARGTGVSTTYTSSVSTGGTTFAQGVVSGEINGDQGFFTINYTGATGVTVLNLNAPSTFVYINNAGALAQQITEPTREDWVRKIFTMRIAVDTSTNLILGFEYLNNPIGHYANSQRDIYKFLLLAGVPFKEDQLVTGRATDLGFDVSAGSFLEFGGTGDIYNPNIPPVAAVTNATFFLSTRTGFDAGGNTDLPKFWDNNGTLTALGSTTLVGHRLYRFSNGNLALQYGQGNYANMALAKVGARLEEYVLNPALKNATFFGWWFIESTATNTGGTTLTDFIEYTIGVSGGSSNSLSGCLLKGNNLSDLLDVAAARSNLGVTALDNANVKLTGNQSIDGIKEFIGSLNLLDNVSLKLGTGSDFSIKHNGTNASLTNSTGNIIIQNVSDNITLLSATDISLAVNGSEIGVQITGGGGVSLRHNNVSKLATTATGATVTGDLGSTTLTPTALTTGTIPYKSAGALLDSPISTNGTDVVFNGNISMEGSAPNFRIVIPNSTSGGFRFENAAGDNHWGFKTGPSITGAQNPLSITNFDSTTTPFLIAVNNNITTLADIQSATLTPTALTTNTIPYKSAGALIDSPISTNGTDVTLSGDLSAKQLLIDSPFGAGLDAALIQQGEFNKIGLTVKNTNGSANVNILQVENSSQTVFSVLPSGAATFASSVSATNGLFSGKVGAGLPNPSTTFEVYHATDNIKATISGASTDFNWLAYKQGTTNKWLTGLDTSGNFIIRDEVEGQNVVTISQTDQSATFASSVSATDGLFSNEVSVNGKISPSSSAQFQVNGFMRTGNIYLHTGGNTPNDTRSADFLSNIGGTLNWTGGATFASSVNVGTTASYADNAAAIAGGLSSGTIYRTGDNLKIVH
jgi:hypothetical protein